AEDGIRDRNVTGVQTCALPICNRVTLGTRTAPVRRTWRFVEEGLTTTLMQKEVAHMSISDHGPVEPNHTPLTDDERTLLDTDAEIGRASCRERHEGSGGRCE